MPPESRQCQFQHIQDNTGMLSRHCSNAQIFSSALNWQQAQAIMPPSKCLKWKVEAKSPSDANHRYSVSSSLLQDHRLQEQDTTIAMDQNGKAAGAMRFQTLLPCLCWTFTLDHACQWTRLSLDAHLYAASSASMGYGLALTN